MRCSRPRTRRVCRSPRSWRAATARRDGLGAAWLVVERLDGETIPRKILRDPEWAAARAVLTAQCGRAVAAIHTIDPEACAGLPPADPLGDPLPLLDLLGEARPALELGARWLGAHRPAAGSPGDRARRLPARQPAGRPRRLARRPGLGAGPRRRPGGGHRVAVRPGLALRGPGRGRRLRQRRRSARRVRGRGWRDDRSRPRPLVAGVRHGEVGDHLRVAGVGAPERRHALGGAGSHRTARLRERVGPVLSAGGDAALPRPRSRSRLPQRTSPARRSAGRRRPSWSRRCASISRPG